MLQQRLYAYFSVVVYSTILTSLARAFTNPPDVTALQDFYSALNYPSELKGWRKEGGDPCEESWAGVSCSGSSVIYLKLHGLNLTGNLGGQLNSLNTLKQLDVSSNRLTGGIPRNLPPNATHINMAFNNLSENIPHTLSNLGSLRHLNLSHNTLSGVIGNVFTGLQNLREMDLSYNGFTGDLPSSFGSLTNITRLFLQDNKFTGSVAYLSHLPLIDLNIQDNYFSGIIPGSFRTIPNLWIGGNRFRQEVNSPPWDFPLEKAPVVKNISGPPTTKSNAIQNYPSRGSIVRHEKKRLGPGGIVLLVGGITLVVTFTALFVVFTMKKVHEKKINLKISNILPRSLPLDKSEDGSSTAPEESSRSLSLSSLLMGGPRPIPLLNHTRTEKFSGRKGFSKRCRLPVRTKVYTLAELQSATNNFSDANLLGEGSLGAVYRAEFPDGQVLAVKNINMEELSFTEEEQFLDVVWTASRLRHPNIVTLFGYCVEHGQHLLGYEYVRNLSLGDALHCEAYMPLSWTVRFQIALGVARALDYLHTSFFPPFAHCNLKASNILLDEELMPRICDCGLSVLRPLVINRVKTKASEIVSGDRGYLAPEHGQPGFDNTRSDVYSFGVLLLELVTGRKPFDNSKPRKEQSLVKWASSRLHDNESLEQMVDPGIKGTFSSKTLSRFVDIISLGIQPVKEFRPPMSEIVEHLTKLQKKMEMEKRGAAELGSVTEVDPFEKSFRSTNTGFVSSPAYSYCSTSF
ncbi:protein STRUBBELIG-RECEPTOR FAMILY 2 [Momordica charantia]|uniref:Protein STRUBBELIG-RECEPTOR FAMILY 2 n=1 Tax=Momordica charantia TaxID=3673 RepID=A0A6J1DJQ7_MOMCH|nr:protein STRUBBELIG-RECEPTOR FAMILY 2 [Momordica charantia]XP_022154228.1 protein STRUBBELIG-RECEPTOR FAMILY 2 [Momordica charantia]